VCLRVAGVFIRGERRGGVDGEGTAATQGRAAREGHLRRIDGEELCRRRSAVLAAAQEEKHAKRDEGEQNESANDTTSNLASMGLGLVGLVVFPVTIFIGQLGG